MLLYLFDAICCRGYKRCAWFMVEGHGAWLFFIAMLITALFSDPIFNILGTPSTVAWQLAHFLVQECMCRSIDMLDYSCCRTYKSPGCFFHSPLLLLVSDISYLNIHYSCISSFSYTFWLLFFHNSITVTFHFWSLPNFFWSICETHFFFAT